MSKDERVEKVESVEVVPQDDQSIEDPNVYVPQLAQILSDPTDTRGDREIAKELGIPMKMLRALRRDPDFMVPVHQKFLENLALTLPEILKTFYKNMKLGDSTSGKALIEQIEKISKGAGISGDARSYRHLSDSELETEITRLIAATSPEDVIFDEILTDDEIERGASGVGFGGRVTETQEREAPGSLEGEAEEAGS